MHKMVWENELCYLDPHQGWSSEGHLITVLMYTSWSATDANSYHTLTNVRCISTEALSIKMTVLRSSIQVTAHWYTVYQYTSI